MHSLHVSSIVRRARGQSWTRSFFGPRVTILFLAALLGGCVVVPQNRRRYLADPTMQPVEDPLESRARDKMHTAREAAAGGNGQPAGGGCGCSN